MSDQPVNLNKIRKARARTTAKAQADANAVRFGLTKDQKMRAKGENSRVTRIFDGKALQTPPNGSDDGIE
ncbi:DUF4169 family protein [uncultured Tateyamaria sp.]|uniref:DUF4169 family protein n=1 Tax=uncultured Tateyamaria sp. TaxID=455651 RepID=UPI00260528AB|nr:DUF4169 family protein [uncultured Tateyamaria sp.]